MATIKDKMEEFKIQLADHMRNNLRAAGLKQLDLAAHLGISRSAISQMLSGKITPGTNYLEKTIKLTKCADKEAYIMRDLLARIRAGMPELLSPMNEFLKRSRKAKKITMARLVADSGISMIQLRALENSPMAFPSTEQMTILTELLDLDKDKLLDVYNEMPNYPTDGDAVHEGVASYMVQEGVQVPTLNCELMCAFNPRLEDIKNFVVRHYNQMLRIDDVSQEESENIFAITDSGNNFQPVFAGEMQLFINVNDVPENGNSVVVKFTDSEQLWIKKFVKEDGKEALADFFSTKELVSFDKVDWMRKIVKLSVSDL